MITNKIYRWWIPLFIELNKATLIPLCKIALNIFLDAMPPIDTYGDYFDYE